MTLLDLLNTTTKYFEKYEIESPRLNAEQIIAHALKLKRLDLYLQFERVVKESELNDLRSLVKKRSERVPLQHILGTVEFMGLTLKCDARALVPRPETETLVTELLKKAPTETGLLWDIGTGSGVIGLSFLHHKPGWKMVGTDISSEALTLAEENSNLLDLKNRATFTRTNLIEGLSGESPNLVAANLPYIASSIIPALQKEVQYDPKNALDGGNNGLFLIEKLIKDISLSLKNSYFMLLEIGEDQGKFTQDLFQANGWDSIFCVKDLAGRDRVVGAKK